MWPPDVACLQSLFLLVLLQCSVSSCYFHVHVHSLESVWRLEARARQRKGKRTRWSCSHTTARARSSCVNFSLAQQLAASSSLYTNTSASNWDHHTAAFHFHPLWLERSSAPAKLDASCSYMFLFDALLWGSRQKTETWQLREEQTHDLWLFIQHMASLRSNITHTAYDTKCSTLHARAGN